MRRRLRPRTAPLLKEGPRRECVRGGWWHLSTTPNSEAVEDISVAIDAAPVLMNSLGSPRNFSPTGFSDPQVEQRMPVLPGDKAGLSCIIQPH